MKSCCEIEEGSYYQGETKSGKKWTPAFIEYVDISKCTGCGMCVNICSRDVYELRESNGRKFSFPVNPGNCVGDGSCNRVCKANAIVCAPRRI